MEIRLLAKNKLENRIETARARAIKPLINLVSPSDPRSAEYSVAAIPKRQAASLLPAQVIKCPTRKSCNGQFGFCLEELRFQAEVKEEDEEIPEKEAVYRICFDICEKGNTMKTSSSPITDAATVVSLVIFGTAVSFMKEQPPQHTNEQSPRQMLSLPFIHLLPRRLDDLDHQLLIHVMSDCQDPSQLRPCSI